MNRTNGINGMKRVIICVFISLALMLSGFYMPLLGVMGMLLCPLPLAVLGCLEGHKRMSIAELMIEATLFLVISPSMAVYFLIGCAPVSAFIFMLSRDEFKNAKKYSGAESLLLCTGISLAMKVVLMLVFWFFTGHNMLFPDSAQMNMIMTQMYGDNPELLGALNHVLSVLPYMIPTFTVIYSSAEVYLNYALCNSIMRKHFPESKNFPPELPAFINWKFPLSLLFASVFSLILGYFIDFDTWFAGSMFVLNLQIVLNVFMFIQGLSFAFWLMHGFKFRRFTKAIMCIVFMIPFFWAWLIVMGMCDMALNLRDKIKFGKSE